MFAIVAAMAQLERSIIRERMQAGITRARLRGTKSGRPIGRPRVVFDRTQAVELRAQGMSWRRIAKTGHNPDVRQACLESQEQRYGSG